MSSSLTLQGVVAVTALVGAGVSSPVQGDAVVIVPDQEFVYEEGEEEGYVIGTIATTGGAPVAFIFADSGGPLSTNGLWLLNAEGEVALTAAGAAEGANTWEADVQAYNGYGALSAPGTIGIEAEAPPAPVWGNIAYPDGNRAVSVGAANGKLYMSAWNPLQQQFYRSDDAGLTFPQVGTIAGGAGSGNHWSPVAYSPSLGRLVIVDQFSEKAAYSDDDGATWTVVTVAAARFWSVVWSPVLNLFVTGGGGPGQVPSNIYTSPTGAVWTSRANSATHVKALWCSGFNGGAGQLLMISEGSARRSSDGINWTNQSLGVGVGALGAAYSPTLNLVAVVGPSTFAIRTSPDGVTWTTRAIPPGYWALAVCWDSGRARFIVALTLSTQAASDKLLVSSDGENWSLETIPTARRIFTLAEAGGVVVGADGIGTGNYEPNTDDDYLRWGTT